MIRRKRSTLGRKSEMRTRPAELSHTWSHPGVSTSCVTYQSSAGFLLLFWRQCWVKQRVEICPKL
uniref:Uncharacterized protein n=1 Tax=Anguilla anguilla TaxID=7936 RepID=A0A0E9W0P3_ANGAN